MNHGFGAIVTSDLRLYFCEPNISGNISYDVIMHRLGWHDSELLYTRPLKVRCPDWTITSFAFDESDILPGWAEKNREQIMALVERLLKDCAPAWYQFQKVHEKAMAEYNKTWIENIWDSDQSYGPRIDDYYDTMNEAWREMIKALSQIDGYVGMR